MAAKSRTRFTRRPTRTYYGVPYRYDERVPKKVADEVREIAREAYAERSSDNIEIDDNAPVLASFDAGFWVQAWVWVRAEEE